MSKQRTVPYEPILHQDLNDDEIALAFLNASLEGDDPRPFLLALKQVCGAKGIGMTKLARKTALDRAGIYRLLTQGGNPKFETLSRLLSQLGFRLSVERANPDDDPQVA